MPGHQLIDRAEDLFQRGGEIAFLVDVAEELLRQQQLTGSQREHVELFPQVIDQVLRLDRHRLGVLQLLVLLPRATDLEAVQENLLPVHLLFFFLLLLLLLGILLFGCLLLGIQQLEEGIGQ